MKDTLSRRQLIAAGLGVAAAQAQAGSLNVGVIGVGLRSAAHLKALNQLQDESKIVALSDLESARMEKVAGALPQKPAMYTDYRELLKDKSVQTVSIITP